MAKLLYERWLCNGFGRFELVVFIVDVPFDELGLLLDAADEFIEVVSYILPPASRLQHAVLRSRQCDGWNICEGHHSCSNGPRTNICLSSKLRGVLPPI